MKQEKLFSEFQPVSRSAWKEVAVKDLKGADFEKKLVWKTDEGINVQPFYTSEDVSGLPLDLFERRSPGRSWLNFIEVAADDPGEANRLILKMLAFDVNGVLLSVEDNAGVDFETLLKGVDPLTTEIGFRLRKPSPSLFKSYINYLNSKQVDTEAITGFCQCDLLEEWSLTGIEPDFAGLAEQLRVTAAIPNFKGLMLSSHAFTNAGSNLVQELAYSLSKFTDTVEMLGQYGIKKEQSINQLAFHLAIGGDYFFEIAKLRAFKPVLKTVIGLYLPSIPDVPVLCSNATWSKTIFDPNVNMLRNTTEAMSAILGGCDAILINPHDRSFRKPDFFSQRIAANISNLLAHESYFGRVADPAAGSYYIENITWAIAEKTIGLFKEVEAGGGYIKQFENGRIQEAIDALKTKKENDIATRKRVYVGTNKYPNLDERIEIPRLENLANASSVFALLVPQRAAQNFEWLREITQQEGEVTGRFPRVYLAGFGNPAMRRARAAFASEFFGTSGFEIMGEFYFDDPSAAGRDSAKSDADIVVICSSDADYAVGAKTFAEAFREVNREKKLFLAGYPAELVDSLQEAGVDDFIHAKTDVVEFISALQGDLFAIL